MISLPEMSKYPTMFSCLRIFHQSISSVIDLPIILQKYHRRIFSVILRIIASIHFECRCCVNNSMISLTKIISAKRGSGDSLKRA